MNRFDKLALTVLVLPNAYITALWYLSDVAGFAPGIDTAIALAAGIALDLAAISLLSSKHNNIFKYGASICFGVGSAIIAYYRYNGGLTTFHGGHMLHTFYPMAALFYMLFLTEASKERAREEQRIVDKQQRIVDEQRARGKEQCPKCGKWYKSGGSIKTHVRHCKD